MKTLLLFGIVCLIGQSIVASPSPYGLEEDFQDFLRLLPKKEIHDVVRDYLQNDKEVQAAIQYLHGEEFAAIWKQIITNMKFQEFVDYLENAGLHVVERLNQIAKILDLPKYPPQMLSSTMRTGGLNGLLHDIMALLPKEQLKALFMEKLQKSPDFKALYDKLASADFQKIVSFVRNSPEITSALNALKQQGIDVDKIVEFIKSIFNWH